jgi:hypothetical protein
VQLSAVARLGNADDPAGFGFLANVVRTGRGQFLVSSDPFIGEIFVYDRSGKFVRSIGRRGGGPGEFNGLVRLAVDAQDTVRAVEAGSRYHVIAPDHTIKRSTQLGGRVNDLVAEPDGRLFAAATGTAGAEVTTLSFFDRAGQRSKTFANLPSSSSLDERRRYVAIGPNGNRWSLGPANYVLERWLPDGTSAQKLTADRDWLRETNQPAGDVRERKPPNRLRGLLVDAQGRLYVFVIVADANWKPIGQNPDAEPNKVFDTLIEVIDPKAGTLLARTRVDLIVMPMHGTFAYSTLEDDVGERRLQVWNVSLLQR